MTGQLYYIRSIEHQTGEVWVFWGPDRRGYTSDLVKAGKYSAEEARHICKPNYEEPYAVEVLDGCAITAISPEIMRPLHPASLSDN